MNEKRDLKGFKCMTVRIYVFGDLYFLSFLETFESRKLRKSTEWKDNFLGFINKMNFVANKNYEMNYEQTIQSY